MANPHIFHFLEQSPQIKCLKGSRTDAWKSQFPVLDGMALSLLSLDPKGQREPHWHPNANELGYCLAGKGLMTVLSPGGIHDTFTLEPGVIAFVPRGSIHYIENIGTEPLKLLLCFNHDSPEDLSLSSSLGAMSDKVLGATVNLEPAFFEKLPKSVKPVFITEKQFSATAEPDQQTNRLKVNLDAIQAQIYNQGGWVKPANKTLLPTLDGLAVFRVKLKKNGIREPHWHPNAHELNYLMSGSARITLLSPINKVETFDLKAGDISFLPRGYLHHIENTGDDPAEFAVFFGHESPSDIGLSACLGAFENEVIGSMYDLPAFYFNGLTKFQEDRFIVRELL